MAISAQGKTASTQKFIEIVDIVDDIAILSSGNACLVIEVKATNFELLSADEQEAKIYSYAAMLNSLSFSIQIIIRSKKLDISNYIKLLDAEKDKTQNPYLAKEIGLYKDFVEELVKVNIILDKRFYLVVPYSSLEGGVMGAKAAVSKNAPENEFIIGAKAALHLKADTLHTQLARMNLKAETLGKDQLIKLYYDIFNDVNIDHHQIQNGSKTVVSGGGK